MCREKLAHFLRELALEKEFVQLELELAVLRRYTMSPETVHSETNVHSSEDNAMNLSVEACFPVLQPGQHGCVLEQARPRAFCSARWNILRAFPKHVLASFE